MNNKFKHVTVIAVLLVFIFALNLIAKDLKMPSKPVVLDVMAYGDRSNPEGINWIRIVKEFEKKYPKIKIKYNLLYDEAYHQKVIARLISGNIPDIAYMGADARWGAPWRAANLFVDHRPYIDKNYYDMNLIPSMGPNGEIYEIPIGTSNITTVLFMNKRLLKRLGLREPRTYKDLVKMVPVAKKAGIQLVTIDGADGWSWGSCLLSCIIARMSGELDWVQKAYNGKRKFTDPAFVNSLKMIKRMVDDGVISEDSVRVDYGTNISNYTNEKALFMIQGQWAAMIENKKVQDVTELLAWPKFPGEKNSASNSVAAAIQVGYGMTKKCTNDPNKIKAAMLFLKYFHSYKETTQRLRDSAIVAPILKNYKVPKDLKPVQKSKVRLANKVKTSDVIDAYIIYQGSTDTLLTSSLQMIVAGTMSPEHAAKEIQKSWDLERRNK